MNIKDIVDFAAIRWPSNPCRHVLCYIVLNIIQQIILLRSAVFEAILKKLEF